MGNLKLTADECQLKHLHLRLWVMLPKYAASSIFPFVSLCNLNKTPRASAQTFEAQLLDFHNSITPSASSRGLWTRGDGKGVVLPLSLKQILNLNRRLHFAVTKYGHGSKGAQIEWVGSVLGEGVQMPEPDAVSH